MMPFESQAQRRFMYATDPKMARRFEKKTKNKNLPEKVKKSPMDLAMQLLKERKSKEAFEKKKKYDTKYHSTPERKEYRRKLAVVRRKRGVMGKGGNDMSHAKNGKIVSEKPSANRARHFKGKGTLK
jgi:hypothetical protein|tara:strand:- start:94 stop:474 length:381 start_codon:yes stop_codon:yes gene_type:complete